MLVICVNHLLSGFYKLFINNTQAKTMQYVLYVIFLCESEARLCKKKIMPKFSCSTPSGIAKVNTMFTWLANNLQLHAQGRRVIRKMSVFQSHSCRKLSTCKMWHTFCCFDMIKCQRSNICEAFQGEIAVTTNTSISDQNLMLKHSWL